MSAVRSFRPLALAALLGLSAACAGNTARDPVPSTNAASGNAVAGDAARGRELFLGNACATCHGVTEGDVAKVGPTLFGVLGRQAGTARSMMGPSENMKKYGVIWSVETLDEFLADPNGKVPGTAMVGMLSDPQQRADVIAYLASLK